MFWRGGRRVKKCLMCQVAMLVWSYFAAVFLEPGKVPPGWSPFESDEVGPVTFPSDECTWTDIV